MNKPTLGSQIKKYREASEMTQENLAEVLGLSRQAVSKWESETARPSTENLMRLAEVFQVDLQVLINSREECAKDSVVLPPLVKHPEQPEPTAEPCENHVPNLEEPVPESKSSTRSRVRRLSPAGKAALSVFLTAAIACTFALSLYFIWRIAETDRNQGGGTDNGQLSASNPSMEPDTGIPSGSDFSDTQEAMDSSEVSEPIPVLSDIPDTFAMEKTVRYGFNEFSDLRVPASGQFDETAFSEGVIGNFFYDNSDYALLLIRVLSPVPRDGAAEPEYDVWAAYQKPGKPVSGVEGGSEEYGLSFQDCYLIARIAENCIFTDHLFGEDFENVLGYDGVKITLQSDYESIYNYYFAPDEQGIPKFTFQTSAPSYEADVDGDGMNEIICADDSGREDRISLYDRTDGDFFRYQVQDNIPEDLHLSFSAEACAWLLLNARDYTILSSYRFDPGTQSLIQDNSCFYPEAANTKLTFVRDPSFSGVNERDPLESPGFARNGNPLPSDLTRARLGLQELWRITGLQPEECYVLAAGDTILYSAVDNGFDQRSFFSFSSGNLFGENERSVAGISIIWAELAEWSPLKAAEAVRPDKHSEMGQEELAAWFYNRLAMLKTAEIERTKTLADGQTIRLYLQDGSFFEAIVDSELGVMEDLRGPYPEGFEH